MLTFSNEEFNVLSIKSPWRRGYVDEICDGEGSVIGFKMSQPKDLDEAARQLCILREQDKYLSEGFRGALGKEWIDEYKNNKSNYCPYLDTLPVEFFNHQIRDLDPNACTLNNLKDFCIRWGFLFHPFRCSDYHLDREYRNRNLFPNIEKAIKLTNRMNQMRMSYDMRTLRARKLKNMMQLTDEFADLNSELDWEHWMAISIAELKESLSFFQEFMQLFESRPEGEKVGLLADYGDLIDWSACMDKHFEFYEPRHFTIIELTNAVCNQIEEVFASPDVWRQCENPSCRKLFKSLQTGDAERKRAMRSDASCCCPRCSQKVSRLRRAEKSNIDHGIIWSSRKN